MKNLLLKLTNPALLASAVILAGCSRQETADDHAGHGHGEAKAHIETKDGVAMCTEHNVPEAQCGICKPELAGTLKPGESLQLRLPSASSASMAGMQITNARAGNLTDTVECYAEIAFNQNKLAEIAPLVGGVIQEVAADLGNLVVENQVVARIWSANVAEAVAKAVLAHQTLNREHKLHADRVTPQKDLQEAEATHRAACQQLRTLGFTEAQIDEFSANPQEKVLLEVAAPFAGEIVERTAVRGALIEAGKPLFTVADRSTMWAMLNIPESELARVRVGQPVELRVDSLPEQNFLGKLTWIGAEVDERTRMARARAEVPNPDGQLKARMFARARILTRQVAGALLLPAAAVQRVDSHPLIFVRRAEDLFDARAVQLGAKVGDDWEIAAGVQPGELVAVAHVFALKSQLLISRLGAGCADD